MNALDIAWAILKLDPEKFTPEERGEISRIGGLRRLRGTAGGLARGKDVPLPTDAAVARLIAAQRRPEGDIGEGKTPKQTVLPGAGPQGAPKAGYGGFSPVGEKQMMDDPNLEGEFRPPPRIPLLEGQEALDAEAALSPEPPTQDERYEEMGRGVKELIRPLQRQQRREQLASISDSEKRDLREQAIRQGMDRIWHEHIRDSDWGGRERPPSDAHRQLFTPEAERAKPIIEDYIQSIRDEMGGAPSSQEIRDQMKNFRDYLMRGGQSHPFYDEPGDESILDRLNEEGIHPGGIEHYLHQKHIRPYEIQEGRRERAERKVQVQRRKKKELAAQKRFEEEDPQARLRQQFESMIEGSDEEQPAQKTVGVKSQRPPPPTRGQRRVGVQREGDSNE